MQIKYSVLLVFLFASACTDIVWGKIKNAIVVAGLLSGVFLSFSKEAVAGSVITFLLSFFIYRIGWCGAGDVKLLTMLAFYMGINGLINCAPAILGLALIFAEVCAIAEKKSLFQVEIPFAVPVFLGVIPYLIF